MTQKTPMAGVRPMTPHGLPVIGHLGNQHNTYVSTGHGMMGIITAPGTLVALTGLIVRESRVRNNGRFDIATAVHGFTDV